MKNKPSTQLATLCYIKQDGKTLMLFRNKKENDYHEGKWNGLGGKFEPGETPEMCAQREIFEESGLTVGKLVLKGMIQFPLFDGEKDWFVFCFNAFDCTGDLIDSEEGSLSWIPDADIKKLNLWEGDKIFIPWLEKDGIFSARFEYENGRLKNWKQITYP